MSYNPNPSVITGQVLAASAWNTFVKGNLDTLWPYAAAGDLAIASGSDMLTRLPVGTDGQIMKVVSGSPAWAAPSSGIGLADVFQVGHVHISTSSVNPATYFGFGTWAAITGRMLIGADGTYTAGSTGGAATVTLTTAQIPSHTHADSGHAHDITHSHTYQHTKYNGSLLSVRGSSLGSVDWEATENTPTQSTTNSASAAANIGSTGGGGAHDNMPPYLAVYIWTRTA